MSRKQAVISGVTIDWDDNKHPKINVREGAFDKTKIPKSKTWGADDFIPNRIVIDLKLDLGNSTVSEVTLQDVHLKIPYYNAGVTPTVVWWNKKQDKWVKFKDVRYSAADQIADVTLPSTWPTDPPIGIGP
jgi:hypothetical protein